MKIVIKLGLSEKNDADVLADTGLYMASMGASDNYSDAESTTQITKTNTAAGKLKTSMDSPNSDSKKANVQFYRTGLDFELGKCKNIVSTKSNDPNVPDDKRIEIAASSGMKYTIYGGRNKQSFVVAYGKISGSVLVIMPGGAKSYMVVYTKDLIDYKDRSDPVSSTASRVVIENLEKDKKYAFFYKPIIPGEKSDWIGPITKTVV